jgi:hypothetical protein
MDQYQKEIKNFSKKELIEIPSNHAIFKSLLPPSGLKIHEHDGNPTSTRILSTTDFAILLNVTLVTAGKIRYNDPTIIRKKR